MQDVTIKNIYHVLMVRNLYILPLISSTTLLINHFYGHFIDEETETPTGLLLKAVPIIVELRFKPRFVSFYYAMLWSE